MLEAKPQSELGLERVTSGVGLYVLAAALQLPEGSVGPDVGQDRFRRSDVLFA